MGLVIALDQMPNGSLTLNEITPLLASEDAASQRTALDIVSRRT